MKNIFPPFTKLIAVAACALTLGSCSRAEYAMLPKGGSYHGVTRVATPVPARSAAAVAPEAEVATVAATTPAATTAPAVASAPVATPRAAAQEVATVAQSSQATATTAPKVNAVQRLALNKVTRKVDKLMQRAAVRQHDNTASTAETSAITGNLRTGIILLLVGLLVGIFSNLIGGIIALIGAIFIVLWLLDNI